MTPLHTLQITPVAGLDVNTVLHRDHEVFGAYLAEAMDNDDGSLVLAPLFDRLGHQNLRSGVKSRSRLVCVRS